MVSNSVKREQFCKLVLTNKNKIEVYHLFEVWLHAIDAQTPNGSPCNGEVAG
jgi:hypothetical protein